MYLTRMRFGNAPPFTTPVVFEFDEHVNLFVGPNATGKSRLLSEIDAVLNRREIRREWAIHLDWRTVLAEEWQTLQDWAKNRNLLYADTDLANSYFHPSVSPLPPVVYLGPNRIGLPGISQLAGHQSFGATAEEVLSGEFSGARLHAAIELLAAKTDSMFEAQRQENTPREEYRAHNFLYADQTSHVCAGYICSELLTSTRALNYPTGVNPEWMTEQPLATRDDISINRLLGTKTVDTPSFDHIPPEERPVTGDVIYVGDLSSGSQSTLLWMFWLALKMLNHYEFANDWHKKPAILLIDEIENHLHPTWQRRVIPALLEHFPGLQIFATTHSPFVVAGLRAGQVHMLSRDPNGVVTATTNERDIVGWTTDEILRTFMGVDEPTDQLTVNRANRLRELRAKETLTDEEAEQLAELRRQVNDDFLSSSTPLEAQRDRYGNMMLDFLRSRQSELSQDNG